MRWSITNGGVEMGDQVGRRRGLMQNDLVPKHSIRCHQSVIPLARHFHGLNLSGQIIAWRQQQSLRRKTEVIDELILGSKSPYSESRYDVLFARPDSVISIKAVP
jgi:hypothetical protein